MMYEMLFGVVPFKGGRRHGKKFVTLSQSIVNEELELPNTAQISYSEDCADLVQRLLTKDSCDRIS